MKIYSEKEREVIQALIELERADPDKYTDIVLRVWKDATAYVDAVAESIRRGVNLGFDDGPVYTLDDMFAAPSLDRMTAPSTIQQFVCYGGLMDYLSEAGEAKFREAVSNYNAAWEKFFRVIEGRWPELSAQCAEVAENRRAMTDYFVDLYLGERLPELTARWYKHFIDTHSGLVALKRGMDALGKGKLA